MTLTTGLRERKGSRHIKHSHTSPREGHPCFLSPPGCTVAHFTLILQGKISTLGAIWENVELTIISQSSLRCTYLSDFEILLLVFKTLCMVRPLSWFPESLIGAWHLLSFVLCLSKITVCHKEALLSRPLRQAKLCFIFIMLLVLVDCSHLFFYIHTSDYLVFSLASIAVLSSFCSRSLCNCFEKFFTQAHKAIT